MKDADKEIKYRPELAEQLSKCLNTAVIFYSINFKKAYYLMFSKVHENEGFEEESAFFKEVANCFNEPWAEEQFHEKYEKILRKEYLMEPVSEARAASFVFNVYKEAFDILKEKIHIENPTKMEQYMVNNFFAKLTAPMRNPNIEIQEGYTECWYDRNHENFLKDLKMSVECVKKNCQDIIDIFSIEDEKEFESTEREQI